MRQHNTSRSFSPIERLALVAEGELKSISSDPTHSMAELRDGAVLQRQIHEENQKRSIACYLFLILILFVIRSGSDFDNFGISISGQILNEVQLIIGFLSSITMLIVILYQVNFRLYDDFIDYIILAQFSDSRECSKEDTRLIYASFRPFDFWIRLFDSNSVNLDDDMKATPTNFSSVLSKLIYLVSVIAIAIAIITFACLPLYFSITMPEKGLIGWAITGVTGFIFIVSILVFLYMYIPQAHKISINGTAGEPKS